MASSKNRLHRLFGIDAAQHGAHSRVLADETKHLEVINVGLCRTGTTSMHVALEMLGFGPGHQGIDLARYRDQNEAFNSFYHDINNDLAGPPDIVSTRLRSILQGYRCANDGPINHLPQECITAYPSAKYILCVRDGGDSAWWASVDATLGWHFRTDWTRALYRFLIFPITFIRRQDDFTQKYKRKIELDLGMPFGPQIYTQHAERVKRIIPKEQLLVYNVKEGWDPLCKFLGVAVPNEPFPKMNEAESMRTIYIGMQAYGAFVWVLILFGVGIASTLAMHPSAMWAALYKVWS